MSKTTKQMIKSFFLGGIATGTDYIIFVLCNYVIFKNLSNIPFHFGPFNYEVIDGGLCNFVSMAISYLLGQTMNYFVQKKYAFNKDNSTPKTFASYIIVSIFVYFIVLYIPGIIGGGINSLFGFTFGPLISKAIATFFAFCVQFPINKFVIFK